MRLWGGILAERSNADFLARIEAHKKWKERQFTEEEKKNFGAAHNRVYSRKGKEMRRILRDRAMCRTLTRYGFRDRVLGNAQCESCGRESGVMFYSRVGVLCGCCRGYLDDSES